MNKEKAQKALETVKGVLEYEVEYAEKKLAQFKEKALEDPYEAIRWNGESVGLAQGVLGRDGIKELHDALADVTDPEKALAFVNEWMERANYKTLHPDSGSSTCGFTNALELKSHQEFVRKLVTVMELEAHLRKSIEGEEEDDA